jgi:four helix bundle suffix protein
MNSPESPFLPHGAYRKLRSYKVAEAVYDATVVFCRRFYAQDRRMSDQMVQAARSGVRNISEGSGAAATSRKSEMKLTNVARASLSDELLRDYESFLVQNGLRVWPKDSREALAMRARLAKDDAPDLPPAPAGQVRLRGLARLSEFVERAAPELAANAMVCVVNQAAYLLKRQLESQGQTFLGSGGFTEKLYGARNQMRRSDKSDTSYASDMAAKPPARACPICGQPMVQRIARKGPRANQPFWGCSGYPDCKGTRAANQSEKSDRSDTSANRPKGTP